MQKNKLIEYQVTGDAMQPDFTEGDKVLVDPRQPPRANAKDIAVLKIQDSLHICRFTRFGQQLLMIHDNAPIVVLRSTDVTLVGSVVSSKNKKSPIVCGDETL